MRFLPFSLLFFLTNSQICDDCSYGCCNAFGVCAQYIASCYCRTSTCKHQCCVDEHCGSESECATSSTLAVIIVLISIFGICVLCFTACLCLTRLKRRNAGRNRVRNEENVAEEINLQASANGKSEGVPIENVIIGQPIEFPNEFGQVVEGQPIIETSGRK